MEKRTIVFAPHPDDETLGCGGIIAKKTEKHIPVTIVFMTDGRHSHLHEQGIQTNPTPQELAKIRKEEALKATSVLGINEKNIHFLNFTDGSLSDVQETVKATIKNILHQWEPTETFYPYRKDFHEDHRTTCQIVEALFKDLTISAQRYEYPIWPPTIQDTEKGNKKEIDISQVISQKKKAINAYDSQTTIFSDQQEHPILSSDFLKYFLRPQEIFLKRHGTS